MQTHTDDYTHIVAHRSLYIAHSLCMSMRGVVTVLARADIVFHRWACSTFSPAATKAAAVVACLVYMSISSALIVLNQQLMNEDGFRYPMALSGLGMGFSAVASYIACKVRVDM